MSKSKYNSRQAKLSRALRYDMATDIRDAMARVLPYTCERCGGIANVVEECDGVRLCDPCHWYKKVYCYIHCGQEPDFWYRIGELFPDEYWSVDGHLEYQPPIESIYYPQQARRDEGRYEPWRH